jgi:hypothetical protein
MLSKRREVHLSLGWMKFDLMRTKDGINFTKRTKLLSTHGYVSIFVGRMDAVLGKG